MPNIQVSSNIAQKDKALEFKIENNLTGGTLTKKFIDTSIASDTSEKLIIHDTSTKIPPQENSYLVYTDNKLEWRNIVTTDTNGNTDNLTVDVKYFTDSHLSFLTQVDDESLLSTTIGDDTYNQKYFVKNSSFLCRSVNEVNNLLENQSTNNNGSINDLLIISTLFNSDTGLSQNCKKLNKYFNEFNNTNSIKSNLNIVDKSGDFLEKEVDLIGGTGRMAKILISNNSSLYNENEHVKLNNEYYIKGISTGGYLYKIDDILKINDEKFNNIKLIVKNIKYKNQNKTKSIVKNLNIFNRNVEDFTKLSSFNITINGINYYLKVNDNPLPKIRDTEIISEANTLIYKDKNVISDNILWHNEFINKGVFILKNLQLDGIIQKKSYFVFRLYITPLYENNKINKQDTNKLLIHEIFLNNFDDKTPLSINNNYDLNKSIKIETSQQLLYIELAKQISTSLLKI